MLRCSFCGMDTSVRMHHLIPRAKGGIVTVPACEVCENYIHKTWSHIQLRDTYNTVDAILNDTGFQSFLKWRKKQSPETMLKSIKGRKRNKRKYS